MCPWIGYRLGTKRLILRAKFCKVGPFWLVPTTPKDCLTVQICFKVELRELGNV